MRLSSHYGQLLLKIVLLVFTLNATAGYDACCIATDSGNGNPGIEVGSDNTSPCHALAQAASDTEAPQDTQQSCCSSCMLMQPPQGAVQVFIEAVVDNVNAKPAPLVYPILDPLFRPPIQHLS